MVLGHNFDCGSRTQDVKITQDVTFDTMLLSKTTLKGLKNSGFYKPSPIQLHGIPLGKCGFDLLLEAKSGTGKTAVFTVISLEKIHLNNGLQVIILAPTREIAAQICDVIKQIGGEYKGLIVEVVMGGLPVKDDIERLKKKVQIIVGSPGRLHHLIRDNHIDPSSVRLLVLDEADKLMEKSFRADIEYIISVLPLQKQIIFSSATFSDESKAFINKYVQVSQHICPDSNSVLLGISQKVTVVNYNTNIVRQTQHRFEELLNILSKREFKQCLIFCNYQARVTDLSKMLKKAKWPAEKLYGQQEQLDRLEALKTLQEYKCRILIATDLAARGLDSSHVDLVVNFEPPYEWQTYLHRIGRAGRFGSYGLAVTILSNQEEKKFKELLKAMQVQLDIRNFWNDEQFKYNEHVSELSMPLNNAKTMLNIDETLIVNSHSDLWETIIGETTLDGNAIDSFEMLCTSFKETKDKIESFTDLLDSFQNNDEACDLTKYLCFKETMSLEKYKQHTKHYTSHITNQVETLESVVNPNEHEFETEHEIKGTTSESSRTEDYFRPKSTQRKERKKSLHININTADKKTRNRKCETPQRKSYNKEEEYVSTDESDDKGYNTASYDFKKSQCYSANTGSYSHNTQSQDNYLHRQNGRNKPVYRYTSNYINWYHYLKFRTQQIQMAVYINELSQL